MHQVQGGVLHLPRKVADELAPQKHQKIVHVIVDVRFNGVGALQLLHKGVQLLWGVVALVDLVPQFAGKVGDKVMILSGAWEDTVGEITNINEGKQCLTINVEMFGRETPVEIDFTDVKLL